MLQPLLRVCAILLVASAVAHAAHAQAPLTLGGRVLDRTTQQPIADAVVELVDGARTITDSAGAFSLRARPGAVTVLVDGFGYAAFQQTLRLARDTTILILLDPAAVQLDSIVAAARRVIVSGRVREAATDRVVVDGTVSGPFERDRRLRINGSYRIAVPASTPATVSVRAFGFLPAHATVTADGDTTVDFRLERDPVIERMLQRQLATLNRRVEDARYALRAIDRDVIAGLPAIHLNDYLFNSLLVPPSRIQCFYIDERLENNTYGWGFLETYPMHTIQRIEIINRGAMIRVYTTRFTQLLLTNPGPLPAVEMRALPSVRVVPGIATSYCGSPRRW